ASSAIMQSNMAASRLWTVKCFPRSSRSSFVLPDRGFAEYLQNSFPGFKLEKLERHPQEARSPKKHRSNREGGRRATPKGERAKTANIGRPIGFEVAGYQ